MSFRPIDIANRAKIIPDPGQPPELIWVPVENLVVNDIYQRPLLRKNWTHILKIAANFNWHRFTALEVAPISGGRYAVIDGQHRAHAAALCGIRELPCLRSKMSVEEQAAAFAAINGVVTAVTPFHTYRAAVAAREHWALQAKSAVEAAGCRLMTANKTATDKKPGEVFAIRLIVKACERGEAEVVTAGLTALRKSEWGSESATGYSGFILKPWFLALGHNIQFQKLDLSAFLDEHDIETLYDNAKASAKQVGSLAYKIVTARIVGFLHEELRA